MTTIVTGTLGNCEMLKRSRELAPLQDAALYALLVGHDRTGQCFSLSLPAPPPGPHHRR